MKCVSRSVHTLIDTYEYTHLSPIDRLSPIAYRLSPIVYRLFIGIAYRYRLSPIAYRLSFIVYRLSPIAYRIAI